MAVSTGDSSAHFLDGLSAAEFLATNEDLNTSSETTSSSAEEIQDEHEGCREAVDAALDLALRTIRRTFGRFANITRRTQGMEAYTISGLAVRRLIRQILDECFRRTSPDGGITSCKKRACNTYRARTTLLFRTKALRHVRALNRMTHEIYEAALAEYCSVNPASAHEAAAVAAQRSLEPPKRYTVVHVHLADIRWAPQRTTPP